MYDFLNLIPKLGSCECRDSINAIACTQIITGRRADGSIVYRTTADSCVRAKITCDVMASAHTADDEPLAVTVEHDRLWLFADGQMFIEPVMIYGCTL